MGQINTNNYPTVDSLADADLLIVENAQNGTGTTTPKQLRENAIGTDPLQTTAQTVTGAINELKNSGGLPENPLSTAHGGTGNADGYIRTGRKANTTAGAYATAEGLNNTASADYSHAEGLSTTASDDCAHAEGYTTIASGDYCHAEGYSTTATSGSFGAASHAEGYSTTASNRAAHAEGRSTQAKSDGAHAEGIGSEASSSASHAEGTSTTASNNSAHAEGYFSKAQGASSHAEGEETTAIGSASHASGYYTTAGYNYQTVIGKFNDNKSDSLFEVGNGTTSNAKNNALVVYSDGKISQDNGSTKFKFGNNGTSDGYYDASDTFHAFGSGSGGSTMSKTRYTISSSSWSASQNASGYYTYSVTLNPTLSTSFCPNVSLSGSGDSTIWTDTQKSQYDLIDYYDNTATNTLVLYAKTKPTSTFYIYVEGVNS